MFIALILFQIFFSWNDYYSSTIDIEHLFEGRVFSLQDQPINLSSGDTYVYHCFFHNLHSPTDGGAILYNKRGNSILVERSTFANCSTDELTAAIKVSGGNSIIAYVCGYECYASKRDGFCSVCDDITRTINTVIASSISHCSATQFIIYLQLGFIKVNSANSSHNTATSCSALSCLPYLIENGFGSDISFCSIVNNTANSQICIEMDNTYNTECKNRMKCSNIIQNRKKNIISSTGIFNVIQSTVLENDEPYCKINSNSSIEFFNCTIDSTNGEGSLFTKNGATNSFIVALTFFQTAKCQNLFIQFCPTIKCRTLPNKNIIIQKTIISLLIFLLCDQKYI